MVKIKKLDTTVAENREQENLRADVARTKALTDYVAMMANVEIPEPKNDMEGVGYEE